MKVHRVCCIVCAAWFVFLCLLHYFSARPLWLDERLIFSNIQGASFSKLLGPLNNSQAFPRLYLILINSFSRRFDYSVLALRFFPLLAMLAAFFILAKVFQKIFSQSGSGWQFALFLFSLAGSYSLSYYAAEFKHYSMDLLAVALFLWYVQTQKKYLSGAVSFPFVCATVALPITLLFSYSGFFVFWMIIYNFLFFARKTRTIILLLTAYIVVSALAITWVYVFDIRNTLSVSGLFSYWNDYFVCSESVKCFFRSFGEGIRRFSTWWFGNSKFFVRSGSFLIPLFVCSLFGYGFGSLIKERFRLWGIETIAVVVFLELFVLGLLKKYPFTGERVTLFFAPFVFYLIVKGITALKKYKPLYWGAVFCYLAFLVLCSINALFSYVKLYR